MQATNEAARVTSGIMAGMSFQFQVGAPTVPGVSPVAAVPGGVTTADEIRAQAERQDRLAMLAMTQANSGAVNNNNNNNDNTIVVNVAGVGGGDAMLGNGAWKHFQGGTEPWKV